MYHVQEEKSGSFKKPVANAKLLFTRFFSLYRIVVNADYVKGTAARCL